MTASDSGTLSALVASRFVHGLAALSPAMAGIDARLPDATTTAWFATRSTTSASLEATSTRRSPASRPCPRRSTAPVLSNQSIWSSSRQFEAKALRLSSTLAASRSTLPAAATAGTARAADTAAHGRSSALLGMHAQYEHSPPTSSLSTTAHDIPLRTTRSATFSPGGPAPITTTSNVSTGMSITSLRILTTDSPDQAGQSCRRAWFRCGPGGNPPCSSERGVSHGHSDCAQRQVG